MGEFSTGYQKMIHDCLWMVLTQKHGTALSGSTRSNGLSLPAFLDGRLMSLPVDIIGK